ncbi:MULTISPECIES: hypothetical protein [unclassified Saccharibacter]|uniref:hypothetical protein n=1 Tax=unclassified Saccharibacter TaxID=2648722 RepID=UPI00351B3F2F
MARNENTISNRKEVSVASTLGRTAGLIGLTLLFMALVRFCAPVSHMVQHAAGTALWQRAYVLFHITSALGREQLIMSAIVIVCFLLAFALQMGMLWGWARWKKNSQDEERP